MASADQWLAHAIRLDTEALLGPPWDLRSNDVMQAVREVKTRRVHPSPYPGSRPSSSATQQDVTQPFNVIGAGTREYNMMMNGWLQGATSMPSLPAPCIPSLGHVQH